MGRETALRSLLDWDDSPRALRELLVQRMDGVENPATGLPFLMMKADDPEEQRVAAASFFKAIKNALGTLRDDDKLHLTKESAGVLSLVAELVGSDIRFKEFPAAGMGKVGGNDQGTADTTGPGPGTSNTSGPPKSEVSMVGRTKTGNPLIDMLLSMKAGAEPDADDANKKQKPKGANMKKEEQTTAVAPAAATDPAAAATADPSVADGPAAAAPPDEETVEIGELLDQPEVQEAIMKALMPYMLKSLGISTKTAPGPVVKPVQKATAAASSQPAGQDEHGNVPVTKGGPRELGKGLFTNIVFAK